MADATATGYVPGPKKKRRWGLGFALAIPLTQYNKALLDPRSLSRTITPLEKNPVPAKKIPGGCFALLSEVAPIFQGATHGTDVKWLPECLHN